MLAEIDRIVPAWIDVKGVRDMLGGEDFVERTGSRVKTVLVPIAAVKVDLQAGHIGRSSQSQRAQPRNSTSLCAPSR